MMEKNAKRIREYKALVDRETPKSNLLAGCLRAFWVGGTICALGQFFTALGSRLDLSEMTTPMFTSVLLILLGATLTGLGVYDRIGRYAGAGSIVPITGFANSVVAPAIEFRREGLVMGVGAKLFAIAGPVLTYGISSSVLVGIVYWAARRWFL